MALRTEAKTEIKAEPKTATQTIDLICELAKAKNKSGLSTLISSGICIGTQNGIETASQRIASEKHVDVEALELLISMGAPLNYAVSGAARGGHLTLVEDLIRRGAPLNDAVGGAARGGHLTLVEDLIRRGAPLNDAVGGAARGGHLTLVEDLIRRGAPLNDAVGGAARGGHLTLVEDLIRRGAPLNYAVGGAARGGHLTLVEDLIRRGAPLNYAVGGAARGGHLTLVEDLIRRGAPLNYAVGGAARGGHLTLVEDLIRRGAPLNDAVSGAARGGHLTLVEDLIRRGAPLNYAVSGAARGGYLANETLAVRLLSSLQEPVRRPFAEEAKRSNRTTFDMTALLPRVNTLTTLVQTRRVNLEQALAWEAPEVRGVMAFCRIGRYLPRDLCFLVSAFLSPSLTSEREAKDLFIKMPLEIRKVDLTIDLRNCYLASSRFALFRDSRPSRFEANCQEAKSDVDLDKSIADEIRALTKKDPYFDLLQSHAPKKKQKRLPDLARQTVHAAEHKTVLFANISGGSFEFFKAKTSQGIKMFKYKDPDDLIPTLRISH